MNPHNHPVIGDGQPGKVGHPDPTSQTGNRAAASQALGAERAPRRTLAKTVAQRLLEAVRTQPPGTRIPSERALAAQLDVGRSTVREALNALATLGVLDIRHGRGVFVASSEPAGWSGSAIVPALIRAQTNALLEARLLIQPGVARLAAQRRTHSDFPAVEGMLQGPPPPSQGPD